MNGPEPKDAFGRLLAALQTIRYRIGLALLVLFIGAARLTPGWLLAIHPDPLRWAWVRDRLVSS